jgi:hypothetical protein
VITAEAVAATCAAITGLVAVATIGVQAERRGRRLANRLLGDGPDRPGALDRLDAVWEQMHPNHGGSLRDAVDRIEALVCHHLEAPVAEAHPEKETVSCHHG